MAAAHKGSVLDAAGGEVGGAARWIAELDGFLREHSEPEPPVTVLGRHRPLTAGWLLGRERAAARASVAVAANNASFAFAGAHRRVLVRNALHFLYQSEQHLLASMPRSFHAQIPVVRALLRRADVIVAPTSAMAARVAHHVPAVRDRVVVRPHPVTPLGSRRPVSEPFILVPVLPAPYKNLMSQLRALLVATTRTGRTLEIRVTARREDLPPALADHPRLWALGTVSAESLGHLWRSATAAFFPTRAEAFGYPLAEARAYGVPILSPDTDQAREVAGPALRPYRLDDLDSLTDALAALDAPVAPELHLFDRDAYFRWLLELGATPGAATPGADAAGADAPAAETRDGHGRRQ